MTAGVWPHHDVVLYGDEAAAPEVGGRQRRHGQLLVAPLVRLAGPHLAARHPAQLPTLRAHQLGLGEVVDRLPPQGPGDVRGDNTGATSAVHH